MSATGPAGPRSVYVRPFRVDLDVRPGAPHLLAASALARTLWAALRAGGAPEPASVGLILADDAELARLNQLHMGATGPTDVLSFPLLPQEAYPAHPRGPTGAAPGRGPGAGRTAGAGAPKAIPGRSGAGGRGHAGVAFLLPPGTRLHLGDIVVSVERAIAQAEAGRGGQSGHLRWAPTDEIRLLVTHGALHLCGWDHAEPVEEAGMRALEQALLEADAPKG